MERSWRIELLGRLRASRGGQVITHFRTQKTALLLAYLAYYRDRPHSRSALTELLWPDSSGDAGRANLSNALSWLRRQFHDLPTGTAWLEDQPPSEPCVASPFILADHAFVQLAPDRFTTDVADFEAALRSTGSGRSLSPPLLRAVELYQGELLPGFFDAWVLQERRWLTERYFRSLDRLLRQLESAGDLDEAVRCAQHGVRVDPLREGAHRELIRLYAAAGQPAAARKQFQELERLLREQMGTVPEEATLALIQALPRAKVDAPTQPEAGGLTEHPAMGSPGPEPRRVALVYRRHLEPDEQLLSSLEAYLTSQGHRVFVDRRLPPGVVWAREIERELREADAVIALLSPAAVTSEMLIYELQTAHEAAQERAGRPQIIPVRIRDAGPLPEPLAVVLEPLQHVFWGGPEDTGNLLDALSQALRQLEPPAAAHTSYTVSSPAPAPHSSAAAHPFARPMGGMVPLGSPFYVVRAADEQFRTALMCGDSIILIQGARQMGKTSLLARGLQQAREAGARVVLTDLQMLDRADLESLDRLYRALADWIAYQLDLETPPEQAWKAHLGASTNFERYLQRELLGRSEQRTVWALDEVDRLFQYDYCSQVFGLFRSWHNRRGLDPAGPWSRFTLAIAYATEAHLFITDLDQSPFNVGTHLALLEFTVAQVADLNERYGSPLRGEPEVARFHRLVNGHPYLVSRGLQVMVTDGLELECLEAAIDHDGGIFGDHLRRMLVLLVKDPELCDTVRALLRGERCPSHESFYRLRSAGVLVGTSMEDARLRCPIYRTYLQRHLA